MNNLEIEKKYLVDLNKISLLKNKYKKITQGYLYSDNTTEIRIRSLEEDQRKTYYYTVKISSENLLQRTEIEKEITSDEFYTLLQNLKPNTHLIQKNRYLVPLNNNLIAEVDIYTNELEGLKTVEVEFPSLEETLKFKAPNWFLLDVTNDKSYKNKNLAKTNFKKIKVKSLN